MFSLYSSFIANNTSHKENTMKRLTQTALILATFAASMAAQADWDVTVSNNDQGHLYAASNSFYAEGDLRISRQLSSFDTPDQNGFLYVETVAQFNCAMNAMKVVKATGFKTWDDTGASIDHMVGQWQDVKSHATHSAMLKNLCQTKVAEASSIQYQ